MVNRRCDNCSANLILSKNMKMFVCEYCGSQFPVRDFDNVPVSTQENEECLALQLFDITHVNTFENEHCTKSWEELCAWINAGDTSESCLQGLRNLAAKYNEWAFEDKNCDLLNIAKSKVSALMLQDERALFYKDSGVFAKGKSGTLITDKFIYCIKKQKIEKIAITDICSIYARGFFDTGEWYFNGNKELAIDNMVCTAIEQGLIMALVCTLVKEKQPYGYKIKVFRG